MAMKSLWASPGEPADDRPTTTFSARPGVPVFSPIDPAPHGRPRQVQRELEVDASIDVSAAIDRGTAALLWAADQIELHDPMLPATIRFASRNGPTRIASPILGAWRLRLS